MKNVIKISALLLAGSFLSFTPQKANHAALNSISLKVKNSIKWKASEVALGEIAQNKPVTIDFEFTNTGEAPVLILSVKAGCGCTVTDYSQTPVMPGESTKIKATFNAAAKGSFNKYVTVSTNAEEAPKTLTFTGTVI